MTADIIHFGTEWICEKYAADKVAFAANKNELPIGWITSRHLREVEPDSLFHIRGNTGLTEGLNTAALLICGLAATPFSFANARIGVGNSTTAATSAQTGLIGASTFFRPMNPNYPQVSGAVMSWQSDFRAGEGTFAWNEFTVENGGVKNLNRKVDATLGTKPSGDLWIMTVQITLS